MTTALTTYYDGMSRAEGRAAGFGDANSGVPGDPGKRAARPLHVRRGRIVDYVYFVVATLAAIWLAWLLARESLSWGWWLFLFFVLFWALLAYLLLPRLHSILTRIYVPGYFIGRARTSDGLLGDPINLAIRGSQAQLESAMADAGWTRADPVTARTSMRIVTSTLTRRSYDEAPVSPLLLFGRVQDLAYQQEVEGNPAKRHHVRFWRCPEGWRLPGGGEADWLGAGTFDRAVGFSLFTLQITHKIDRDTDVERDHIVSTLATACPDAQIDVIRDFSTGYHSRNGGGDTITTDGDLPIVDLRNVPARPEYEAAGDVVEEAADRRPVAITLGVLLLALRAVAGLLFIASIVIGWDAFVASLVVDVDDADLDAQVVAQTAAVVVILLATIGVIAQFALIGLIDRGSNWARILAMTLSVISVVVSAIDYFNGGPPVSLRANLFGLPLDILVLLALSSASASAWTRRIRYLRLRRAHTTSPKGHSARDA